MALETITAGNSETVIPSNRVEEVILSVIDGAEGFLADSEDVTPQSAQRVTPGDTLTVDSDEDTLEQLHAVGADLTYQVTRQDSQTDRQTRRLSVDRSSSTVVRQLARRTNHSPGADTDILSADVSPPETGTLAVKVVLNSAAVFNVQEDIDGGPELEEDLNSGNSLTAGAGFVFTIPCRGDASYNFQVESAVQVNVLQVDYTREVRD